MVRVGDLVLQHVEVKELLELLVVDAAVLVLVNQREDFICVIRIDLVAEVKELLDQ